jgi:uncharacterized membrane protein YidH (DUF202 family)
MKHITRFNSGLIAIIFALLAIVFFQSVRYSAHIEYHVSKDLPIWFHIGFVLMLVSIVFSTLFCLVAWAYTPHNNLQTNAEETTELDTVVG